MVVVIGLSSKTVNLGSVEHGNAMRPEGYYCALVTVFFTT
jgi:hypothetical protein